MVAGILSRFRPFLLIGAAIVIWVVVFNFGLLALDRSSALAWLPDRSAGIGYILESRDRVSGAVTAYRDGNVAADRPLAAVIGISDVREGVRLEVLSKDMGERWRFLGVAGAGAGMPAVAEQAAILTDSDLRPDVAIIGFTPLDFIDVSKLRQGDAAVAETQSVKDRVRDTVRDGAWIVRRRADISGWFDTTLLGVHGQLQKALGGADAKAPADNPWRPLMRTLGVEHYPADFLRKSLNRLRLSGGDKIETYSQSGAAKVAGDLIRRLQARGTRVVLVEMPLHPWLRDTLPAGVSDLIAARLRQESGSPNLTILNYSDRVSADGFIDLVHLNTPGGKDLSGLMAADLDRLNISTFNPRPIATK
ncbi:hypothetical protein FPZ24_11775 [Sphingomonas panacisoli]|uniref:Uncharacterized protein n=1 Tax=Sphingomonas panacisoli TaxID=1813879 RepID=A0A5B8LJE1_9SPHN|nr:hypothetical protein [Sphingomonas panacisoli]QDZ08076.1 hypothetical protein FPZ24_11775 [Sphingomonas panacisoli]